MEKGDRVKLIDSSYILRVDSYEENSYPSHTDCVFEVVKTLDSTLSSSTGPVHNIYIRDIDSGKIYLHTKRFLRVIKAIKEITISEIEEKFGCKVKIIK